MRVLQVVGSLLLVICSTPQVVVGQSFDQLLEVIKEDTYEQSEEKIVNYIASQGGLPLIYGDTVIFLAKSPFSTPRISSGFNGFLNPRYITDSQAGIMTRIPGTHWYYLKQILLPEARIFYQIVIDSIGYNDPLNQRLGYRFNLINSEVRMPEFQISPEVVDNQFVPAGKLTTLDLKSESYPERNVQIYTPPGYDESGPPYPTVMFHDGSFYLEWGQVPTILNNLIAAKKIPPLIAVFDNPVTRGQEYRGDSSYIKYVEHDLIPAVDMQFNTNPLAVHRAVVGGSRGGMSSLIISHATGVFSKCGVFAPAIHPWELGEFWSFLKSFDSSPDQVVIIASIYDGIWYQDQLGLKQYFEQLPIQFHYREIASGHNLQSWITELDTMLCTFFPQ